MIVEENNIYFPFYGTAALVRNYLFQSQKRIPSACHSINESQVKLSIECFKCVSYFLLFSSAHDTFTVMMSCNYTGSVSSKYYKIYSFTRRHVKNPHSPAEQN